MQRITLVFSRVVNEMCFAAGIDGCGIEGCIGKPLRKDEIVHEMSVALHPAAESAKKNSAVKALFFIL